MSDQKEVLSIRDAAQYLCCSSGHIYNLMRRGDLLAARVGGRTLVRASDLRKLVDASSQVFTPKPSGRRGRRSSAEIVRPKGGPDIRSGDLRMRAPIFREAMLVARSGGDKVSSRPTPILNHAAGDAQFFHRMPSGTCALRPVLASETPQAVPLEGAVMLVCRSIEGDILRAIIQLPAHRRNNSRSNVRCAIAALSEVDARCAEMFDAMNRGVEPPIL